MSCPYLEKGRMAYCHAFENARLGVGSSGDEAVCFSGEFSECSFLFASPSVESRRRPRGQKNSEAILFNYPFHAKGTAKLKGIIRG
jgi:hypothetical protein